MPVDLKELRGRLGKGRPSIESRLLHLPDPVPGHGQLLAPAG